MTADPMALAHPAHDPVLRFSPAGSLLFSLITPAPCGTVPGPQGFCVRDGVVAYRPAGFGGEDFGTTGRGLRST